MVKVFSFLISLASVIVVGLVVATQKSRQFIKKPLYDR